MIFDKEKVTPMMRQYIDTKEQYNDCILFYRLGDFYEMFFDDAEIASKVLDLTLTKKLAEKTFLLQCVECHIMLQTFISQNYCKKVSKSAYVSK